MLAIKLTDGSQCNQHPLATLARVEMLMRELTGADGILGRSIGHHLSAGGNRVRARIALDAATRLELPHEDALAIAAACELLHNASLLHDDLMDRDQERRGTETVWLKFGDDAALLAGDALISAAFAALAGIRSKSRLPEVVRRAHQAVATTIRGQSMEAVAKKVCSLPAYERIAASKSAPLLALPLAAPLLLANHSRFLVAAETAADALGVAYQIVDDIADVDDDERTSAKPGALNVVHVLERQDDIPRVAAAALAAQHARRRLEDCRGYATTLPRRAGVPLIALGEKLISKLEEVRNAS